MKIIRTAGLLVMIICTAAFLSEAQIFISKPAVLEVLYKQEILGSLDQSILKDFIAALERGLYEEEDLEELALAVSNKVKRDQKSLNSLVYFLGELVENKYAARLARVNDRDIRSYKKKLKKLDEQTQDLFEYQVLAENRPNKAGYTNAIKRDIKPLFDHTSSSIPLIWKSVRSQYKTAYSRWNQEFNRLESAHLKIDRKEIYGPGGNKPRKYYEIPSAPQPYQTMATRYDVEELEFMRDFQKAQAIFRRISNSVSSDF